jgi:hypothetical protein
MAIPARMTPRAGPRASFPAAENLFLPIKVCYPCLAGILKCAGGSQPRPVKPPGEINRGRVLPQVIPGPPGPVSRKSLNGFMNPV